MKSRPHDAREVNRRKAGDATHGPARRIATTSPTMRQDARRRFGPSAGLHLQGQVGNQTVVQMMNAGTGNAPPVILNRLMPILLREGDGEPAKPVDTAAADRDLATFKERVAKIKQLNTPGFIGLMERYVAAIKAGNQDAVNSLIEKIVSVMDRQRAFQIQGTVYQDVSDTSGDVPREMSKQSQQAAEGLNLWSKLTALPPLRRIQETGKGVSLESSLAGGLFDKLSFGVPWGNKMLDKQWSLISRSFVKYAQGVVHCMVLEGVHEESVFFTIEWPVIEQLLKEGRVTALIVHVYDVPGNDYDADIEQKKRYWVMSAADFGRIPKVTADDPVFKEKQNHDYKNYGNLGSMDPRFQRLDADA